MRAMLRPRGAFRTLWSSERDEYLEHLQRLSQNCRRLRFHRTMSDDALALHADAAFENHAHVIGWFLDGELRGAAEVVVFDGPNGPEAEAAFAVEEPFRGRGVGRELMHRASLYARNRNARALHIATERENRAMLRLAMGSGTKFEISGGEADGVLTSEPRNVFSLLLETAEEEAGLIHWAFDAAALWMGRSWRRVWRRAAAAAWFGPWASIAAAPSPRREDAAPMVKRIPAE